MRWNLIPCAIARRFVPLLAGDDLPGLLLGPVRRHVDGCVACGREAVRFVAMRGALSGLRREDLPEGLARGFWQEVHRRTYGAGLVETRAAIPARAPLAGLLRFAIPGAVAAALVVLALARWDRPTGDPGASQVVGGPGIAAPTETTEVPGGVGAGTPGVDRDDAAPVRLTPTGRRIGVGRELADAEGTRRVRAVHALEAWGAEGPRSGVRFAIEEFDEEAGPALARVALVDF